MRARAHALRFGRSLSRTIQRQIMQLGGLAVIPENPRYGLPRHMGCTSSVVIRISGRGLNPMWSRCGGVRLRGCFAPARRQRRDREALGVSYRWVEHTAEVQLKIEARTEEGVFADALLALAELLADEVHGEQVLREVAVDGEERASLWWAGWTSWWSWPRRRISCPRRWEKSSSRNAA